MRILGITLGDPGGVGPEIVLKALAGFDFGSDSVPVVFGPKSILKHPFLVPFLKKEFLPWAGRKHVVAGKWYWMDIPLEAELEVGSPNADNGAVSCRSVECAAIHALLEEIDALVTAPISKTSWRMAGVLESGHTTLLGRLAGDETVSMAFYTPKLKTILATVHVPLMKVGSLLTEALLTQTVDHALLLCETLGISEPRLALAGLNPHAGEGGLFGTEEASLLIPFAEKMREKGVDLAGPFPPDVVYRQAYDGRFDLVVSLYHDQGLIPIKLLAFEEAVNVTVGLPYVRTSPDHGTAFDIAYTGQASATSIVAAMQLAVRLVTNETPR